MHTKIRVYLTSLLLALGVAASGPGLAGPDLPKPPDPDDLPGVNLDERKWWDPLGLFADDDDDDHRGKKKHHNKDKKHPKHKKD